MNDTGTYPEQQRALVVDFSAAFISLWPCPRIAADFQPFDLTSVVAGQRVVRSVRFEFVDDKDVICTVAS